jgi:hypothetical protein
VTAARAAAIWVAVIVLGAGVALATTESSMGVPPTRLGMAALTVVVLIFGGLALLGDEDRPVRRGAVVGGLILLGVVGAQDFLRPGIVFAHDLYHHSWGLFSTWRSVLDGDPWPRWNPYLGLGMPLLPFYCPVGYVAAWPAQAAGASPIEAVKALVVGAQIATAASVYASVRWAGGSRAAGLLGAAALALAPYHLMDQTFRLALGELLSFVWLPPITVAVWKVARGERGRAPAVLGVCLALLLGTHLLSVIEIAFVLVPLTAWTLLRKGGRVRPRKQAAAGLVLCALLTMGATAAWWLPILAEQEHTSIAKLSPPRSRISGYAASLDEPVRRRMWRRYDIRYKRGDREDPGAGMPMYFGAVLLALTLLALAARPREEDDGPPIRAFAATSVVTLALATWPFAIALDGVPAISRIMFPWRLYAPASVLAALAVGLSLDRWIPASAATRRVRAGLVLLAVGALAFDVAPYLGAPQRYPDHEDQGFVVFRGRREAVPTTVPAGPFVRIEMAPLPPTDYRFRTALSRLVFPEYMSPKLRRSYGRFSKIPTIEQSEAYGVGWRYTWGNSREQVLDPGPLVWFREEGGAYEPLPCATWTLKPERVLIELPPGLGSGSVRFVQAWFPGWQARVDGGAWVTALRSEQLQAVRVQAGARQVEFHYSAFRPVHRSVGLGISLLSFLLIAGAAYRRRS